MPILKKCGYSDAGPLEEEAAIQVKNEALRSLKERLLTRATIIQNRLDQEQQNLENAYVSISFNSMSQRSLNLKNLNLGATLSTCNGWLWLSYDWA